MNCPPPTARLLRRLSGTAGQAQLDDLRRLLQQRLGDAPACPHLGLPTLPPWQPDAEQRRQLQEAMALSLRQGDTRFSEVRVAQRGDGETHAFVVQARCVGGLAIGATVSIDGQGRLETTA
jgi:hypothetical protein